MVYSLCFPPVLCTVILTCILLWHVVSLGRISLLKFRSDVQRIILVKVSIDEENAGRTHFFSFYFHAYQIAVSLREEFGYMLPFPHSTEGTHADFIKDFLIDKSRATFGFIYSFNKQSLNIYYVPSPVLDSKNTTVNKGDAVPDLLQTSW